MIGRVVRGWRAHGLLAYLFGPGSHHEHENPHVVAAWDGCPQLHQPHELASGRFDVRTLAAALTAPAVAAGVPQQPPAVYDGQDRPQGPVWHCSVRAAPEDRELSDVEWAEIVADVLHRTGIASRDDPGGCRWVAVRHAADHVHLAAVLVRQDTLRRVHPRRDYHRVREACMAAEAAYGLRPTSPADRTAPRNATRGEQEKAARQGREPSREQLRRIVRLAAARANGSEEFLQLLAADAGVKVRARRSAVGGLLGYAVAVRGDRARPDSPPGEDGLVWFGGRQLAADLSAVRLVERWASAPYPQAVTDRHTAWNAAAAAVERARTAMAEGEDPAGIAHATGDMLLVLGHVVDPRRYPAPADAAIAFERAARHPGRGQPARWSRTAADLRTTAWQLARVRTDRGTHAAAVLGLALVLGALVAELAVWRAQRHQLAASAAADRAAQALAGYTAQLAEQYRRQPAPTAARPESASQTAALARTPHLRRMTPGSHSTKPQPAHRASHRR
ncbi:hypothetical protein FFT09_09280 [Saccharomonospora piscinae]|uniref:relaxase/mobilization nuclease domain-containing protein n=1 Tax=Saccharomonospora piscinae TaxID=687388 RepID=UPI001105ED96|nr:hypothetical protein [Saccharomonospora piscinae]TLW93561.1 hypothetical protein FFT09_09280 [Saccharomonospora piscinae]